MEPGKHKFGLLMKITAVVLIVAVATSVFCPPRPAEAFIQEIIAAIVIGICEGVLKFMMKKLAEFAGNIFEAVGETYLDDVILQVEKRLRWELDKKLYKVDHNRLGSFETQLSKFQGYLQSFLYPAASRSDGLDFNAGWNGEGFNREHPGYRDVSPGQAAVIFSREYAKRLDAYSAGTEKVLEANRMMAWSPLPSAAGSYTAQLGDMYKAIKDSHSTLMSAGELTKSGYAALTDAKSRILAISNEQAAAVRAAQTIHNDTAARIALNELQEKSDRAAAFEQAVKKWNVSAPSMGY